MDSDIDRLVIDDCERGVFRIHRSVFTDERILASERERIFDRCWLYAGHVSEVSKPGDFLTRKVGGRPIIIVRGDDSTVRVLLNTCRHRANLVAREPSGSGLKTFRCFYHGWIYNTRGQLVGVPEADAYSSAFNKSDMGLMPVPRIEIYRGLVFVSYYTQIEGLVDYLAEAKDSLDLFLDYADELEVPKGSHAYSMRGNWKLLTENSFDGYHTLITHERQFSTANGYVPDGQGRSLGNGHVIFGEGKLKRPTYLNQIAGPELQQQRERLEKKHGRERAERIMAVNGNTLIYPNLIIVDRWRTLRTVFPVRTDFSEVQSWALLPKGEDKSLRAKRLDNYSLFVGPGGFGTPDDVEAIESCQLAYGTQKEVEWSDASRGMHRSPQNFNDELQIRAVWREWRSRMTHMRHATVHDDRVVQVA
jgi:p-cumate 2,3-dioxygenase alpha subunit